MLMDKKILLFLALSAAGYPLCSQAQSQFKLQTQEIKNADNEPAPVFPVPSDRQLKWNETEFYAFYHYGMNTYTDKEWGGGGEPESKFAPTAKPNPRQWLETAKKAGMKGGIAVVKHHDGFCLWPTETTTHSVLKAGNANGRATNIPKDFAEAAHDLKMKYGFYVSPWDMNSAYWGDGTDNYAKKVFLPQCAELAKYGADQFEMWFDGATGGDHAGYYGGANTTRTISDAGIYYDMPNLRDSIHNICPNIIMWGLGGEARWIGNEAGWAGETCWSMGDYLAENKLVLRHLLCTHGHFDHVFGAQFVCDTYHLQPEMCAGEVSTYLQAAEQMRMFLHRDFPLTLPSVGNTFKDGDLITFGNHQLRVIETPGHTPGGVCFYCEAEKLIFSGDSLFCHEIGRCDLPGGNEAQLIRVLKEKILSLPSDVNVLPGHGVATTIGEEKRGNRYLL